jgi:hypothetical protein
VVELCLDLSFGEDALVVDADSAFQVLGFHSDGGH